MRPTDSPVGFATGGGAREGSHTLAFEGSKILPADKQVYVLKECPPAFSVGKAVVDDGHLFVWDPREDRPFLVPKEELHRCKLRVPKGACTTARTELSSLYGSQGIFRHTCLPYQDGRGR